MHQAHWEENAHYSTRIKGYIPATQNRYCISMAQASRKSKGTNTLNMRANGMDESATKLQIHVVGRKSKSIFGAHVVVQIPVSILIKNEVKSLQQKIDGEKWPYKKACKR